MKKINYFIMQKGQQLLQRGDRLALTILNHTLPQIVPFNRGHHIKILKITPSKIETLLPFKLANKNHVATMHACAIATIGEFSAGIMLMREIPLYKYRMILKELSTEYHQQAKENLIANVTLPAGFEQEKKELYTQGALFIPLITEIKTSDGQNIATTTSLWHLKKWDLVTYH